MLGELEVAQPAVARGLWVRAAELAVDDGARADLEVAPFAAWVGLVEPPVARTLGEEQGRAREPVTVEATLENGMKVIVRPDRRAWSSVSR